MLLYSWFSPLSLPSSVAAALWRSCSPLGSHTCRGANPNIRGSGAAGGSCCRSALEARILELFKMKTLLFNSSCAFKCEDGAGRRLGLNIARPLLWMRGRGRGAAAITGEGRPPGCGAIILGEEIDGSLSTALPARETGIGGYLGIPPASSSSSGSRAAAERSAEPGNGTAPKQQFNHKAFIGVTRESCSFSLSPEVLSLSLGCVRFSIYLQVRFYPVQATDMSRPRHLPGNKEHC